MIRTIVAATDLADRPDSALRSGAALAQQFGARLIAVHATDDVSKGAGAELQTRIAELPVEAEARIAPGNDAAALLKATRANDADLLVLGPHRHGLLADLFGTSTVEQVIEDSSRLILVTGPQAPARYDRIVVATDFSDCSLAAAQAALQLFPDAQILLVHAFHVPFEGFLRDDDNAIYLREEAEKQLSAFRARLGEVANLEAQIHEGETPGGRIVQSDPAQRCAAPCPGQPRRRWRRLRPARQHRARRARIATMRRPGRTGGVRG
jgi:nucleotide-binding universal stress UspA family protein